MRAGAVNGEEYFAQGYCIWPWMVLAKASPSTSYAKAWSKHPSNPCEIGPAGTRRPCSIFSNLHADNLDTEPCPSAFAISKRLTHKDRD